MDLVASGSGHFEQCLGIYVDGIRKTTKVPGQDNFSRTWSTYPVIGVEGYCYT